MDDFLKESLDQLAAARKSGQPDEVLEALEEVISFSDDERANLAYIEEMEKLALSLGNKEAHLTALCFRCGSYQELEEWPQLRSAAEAYQREARNCGDKDEIATALFFLTEADLAEGDLKQADAHLKEGIELISQTTTNALLDNARAIRVLSLRQQLARAQGDQSTAQLLEGELEKLNAQTQQILRSQLADSLPKPPGASGVAVVLIAVAVAFLWAYFTH